MPSRWLPDPRLCSSLPQRQQHRRLQAPAHSAVKNRTALHSRQPPSRCCATAGASPLGQALANWTRATVQLRSRRQRRVRPGPGQRMRCLHSAGRPVPAACTPPAPPACGWTSAPPVRGWRCRQTVSALLLCSTAQIPQVRQAPPALLQSPPGSLSTKLVFKQRPNLVSTTYVLARIMPAASWRCAGAHYSRSAPGSCRTQKVV